MKLWMLPFVREGITPVATGVGRVRAHVTLQLSSPGRRTRDVSRVVELLGPGDVIAIEPQQVLRATPARGARDAEPDFFPTVEFDAPDLPWAYSPALPEGSHLLPWIVLITLEARPGVNVVSGERGQSPWILRLPTEVARTELPDLADAWTWVHAQIACGTADEIAETLARHPDRTLSRLISPRRLMPNREYHACIVPAFLAGRIAGLGGNPATDAAVRTGREPAWGGTDLPQELPVYYTWSFRTGAAGDFEALAQRLRPTPLDVSTRPTPLRCALPDTPPETAPPVVDWEAPLRVPGTAPTRARRPAGAVTKIRAALTGVATPPVLGPSYFGSSWVDGRTLTPITDWAPEINLTPMWRAAAGLGAEAVRGEQDALVAAATDQLEAHRKAQREGRRRQLATTVVNRVKLRLAAAPAAERARVFSPVIAQGQTAAANIGLYTSAGRRLTRKTWQAGPVRPDPRPGGPIVGPVGPVLDPVRAAAPAGELVDLIPAIIYRPAIERVPVVVGSLPIAPVTAHTIPTGRFAPRFARPVSELLADRFPELMLPGGGAIPNEGVLLVESDPAFVETFLVGANQELNYELLWRGLPSDASATAFRRFWGHASGAEDIDAINTWAPGSPLGTHVKVKPAMVLLVRGELVRRYPSIVVAAVPAMWNADGTRSPVKDPPTLVLPIFRGRIGADIVYAGFSSPSLTEAIGKPERTGPPGWFVLLSENPGDPRFGLDPEGGSGPPTRATLSWAHLTLEPNATYARLSAFPSVGDAGFTPATATSASMANLVRQRPFRAFLHASLLVRPPS